MANRFNRWAPTQAVSLPVDYYQTALMLKEQRTQESIDNIEGLINQYGAIKAVSPDAEALYNETIDQLKTNVEAVGKENLTTPQAQRKVNKMFKDPAIVDNLDKVYTDALLAAEAKKNLNEYLKKNPSVNAVDHLMAFNQLGKETGDSTKFDPNRFKNMPALSDYYDVNKLIADEVTKLKANEEEVKRIVGDKYQSYKDSGVLEDRIRELARDRVLADPQAYGQFQRNIRYQNYLADPYDADNGMRKNAMAFRQGIASQQQAIQNRISTIAKGRPDNKLKKDDPTAYQQIQQGRALLKDLGQYTRESQPGQFEMGDEDIVNKMGMDRFVESFDAYAWRSRKEEEEWTPMAIAQFNAREAMKRLRARERARAKTLKDIFNPEMQHLTIPGVSEQGDLTPDNWNGYIKDRVPNLKLNISKEGFLTGDNNEYTRGSGKNGKYYKNDDVITVSAGADPPEGYQKQSIGADYRGHARVYVKEGATSYDKMPDPKKIQQDNVDNLRKYVNMKGLSNDYDWDNESDQRRALQDVVRFNQAWEKAYMTAHTFPAGNTDSFRERVVEMIGRTPVYDEKGKMISKSDLPKMLEQFRKEKPTINGQPTDFTTKQPMYTFQLEGKTYRIPMHVEMQGTLAVPNDMLNRAMNSETGIFEYGQNQDLFINKMGPGGRPINMVVAGGGQPAFQSKAKELYESNVSNLKEIGFSDKEAEDYLGKNYMSIQDAINADYQTGLVVTNPTNGKTTTIKYAVGKQRMGNRTNLFKYFTNQLSPSPDLQGYIYNRMQEFGSGQNPGMNLLGFDVYPQKERAALFKSMADGDEDDFGLEE